MGTRCRPGRRHRGNRCRTCPAPAVRPPRRPDPEGTGLAGTATGTHGLRLSARTGGEAHHRHRPHCGRSDREQTMYPLWRRSGSGWSSATRGGNGTGALLADEPRCNLHVFGSQSPEPLRHVIFRDWLRGNPADRERYAAVKRQAASEADAGGEHDAVQRPQAAGYPGTSTTRRSRPQACFKSDVAARSCGDAFGGLVKSYAEAAARPTGPEWTVG